MSENTDVDLDKLLSEPGTETTPSASTETVSTQPAGEGVKAPETSERENARIRELVDETKALKAQLAERGTTESSEQPRSNAQPSDLESFLKESVADEASRRVLRQVAEFVKKDVESKYAPSLSEIDAIKAEKQWDSLESKIPGLSAYKAEVFKSLKNQPGANLKSLVGEILIDKQLSKIKPTETQGSQVSRETPDLDSMELDDLYSLLGAK